MRYKVWVDNDEAWDDATAAKPDIEVEADTDAGAAMEARWRITGRYHNALKFIVQPIDRVSVVYTAVELEMRPYAIAVMPRTIDELRDEIVVAPVTSRAVRASKGGRR